MLCAGQEVKLQEFCLKVLIFFMILESGKDLVHKLEDASFVKTKGLKKAETKDRLVIFKLLALRQKKRDVAIETWFT